MLNFLRERYFYPWVDIFYESKHYVFILCCDKFDIIVDIFSNAITLVKDIFVVANSKFP